EFDPETGEIVRTFFAGANPTRLAVSADGTYLYAAVQNGRNVARSVLETGEVDLTFSLGKQNDTEHRSVSSLLVLPGTPESVAVGMTAGGHGAGLAVFDDGIMRPGANSRSVGPLAFDETGERLFA